jgi:hypothetical protein
MAYSVMQLAVRGPLCSLHDVLQMWVMLLNASILRPKWMLLISGILSPSLTHHDPNLDAGAFESRFPHFVRPYCCHQLILGTKHPRSGAAVVLNHWWCLPSDVAVRNNASHCWVVTEGSSELLLGVWCGTAHSKQREVGREALGGGGPVDQLPLYWTLLCKRSKLKTYHTRTGVPAALRSSA